MDGPRKYQPWSLENFDDGYVGPRGRFLVYLPDHPRARKGGYVLRSIAAYEAYHPGVIVNSDMVVHHNDEDKLNDSWINLILQTPKYHNHYHNSDTRHPHWKGDAANPHSKYLRALKAKKEALAEGRLTPAIEAEFERAKIEARPYNRQRMRRYRTKKRMELTY